MFLHVDLLGIVHAPGVFTHLPGSSILPFGADNAVGLRGRWRLRQTAFMPTVFSVQAASRAECERQLRMLCARLGLRPLLEPTRSAGTDRWMARATPAAPAEDEGRR
jgi:hypothetical protein